LLWKILLEYFCGRFTVDLVDDVSLGPRHYALAPYWDTAVADGPGSLRFAREQSVGEPTGDDFVIAILVGWFLQTEVVASSPTEGGTAR
jgi:hypothetical protein